MGQSPGLIQSWHKQQGQPASSDPALPVPSHHPGVARAQLQKGGPHPPHASDPLRNKERSCYKGPCCPPSACWGENGVWMETGGRGRPHTALSSHSKMCRKPVHAGSKLRGRSKVPWSTPADPSFVRLQRDCHFQASLGYVVRPCFFVFSLNKFK